MKCDGASLLRWTLSPWRRGGLLFWQSSSLGPCSCLVAPPAPPGASACATTATEHVNHVSTRLGLNAPKSIGFSYHAVINIDVFRFRNVKTFWCVNQPESLAQGVSVRAGHRRRRRTFHTHSFIYSLSKLASQCIGKRKGEEKGAFPSGEPARGRVSGVICIWMETFSPELKEKTQFITVA